MDSDTPRRPRNRRLAAGALGALDAAVALYGVLTVLCLATGGVSFGVLAVHRVSKPLLVLLVLAAVRAALPGGSWLARGLRGAQANLAAAYAALERRTRWTCSLLDASAAVLTVHLVAKLAAFLANLLLPPARPRPFALPFASAAWAQTFAAWDSGWYFDIARRGYYFRAQGQSSIAFFPLYPLLMRALAWPFGGGDRALWAAGIALSYLALLAGLTVLHRFTWGRLGDAESARRTVLYVAVFPFAYFFTQVYTESLFLLLTVSAVAAATSSRWGWAGLLGALAALTRPNGVLIALPLALMAIADRPRIGAVVRRALAVGLVPLGLGLFCAYCWRLSGDPLAWLHAQAQWGFSVGNVPWNELMRLLDGLAGRGPYGYFFSDPLAPYYFLQGTAALALLALLPAVFARLGPALGAYVAVSLYLPLSGNALEGIGRYAVTLFPVFMLLGSLRTRWLHEAILVTGALLLSLLQALFVTLHPVY
ncbi:MAG TPA: mannosyltransferase family protein [Vicinamibacteria bacterium]|nr:mannosyltransferase family protein [Vicinamibacteria bacterium]